MRHGRGRPCRRTPRRRRATPRAGACAGSAVGAGQPAGSPDSHRADGRNCSSSQASRPRARWRDRALAHHGGGRGECQQHEGVVVQVARVVDRPVVEVEPPGVAAVSLGGVTVQESQAQPHRFGCAGQAGQVGLGEHVRPGVPPRAGGGTARCRRASAGPAPRRSRRADGPRPGPARAARQPRVASLPGRRARRLARVGRLRSLG